MAQTTWSVQAIDDLFEIEEYLSRNSKAHAVLVTDAIVEAVGLLETFPHTGRVVPELGLQNLRELMVKKYRVVYYLTFQDEVEIVTIRHSSLPFDTPLPFG